MVNVRDAAWATHPFGADCLFEGREAQFDEFGIRLVALLFGQPNGLYHREETQKDFLCPLRRVPTPRRGGRAPAWRVGFHPLRAQHEHIFVGAGEGPCVILMTGTRKPGRPIFYPVSELALRHRARVEKETSSARLGSPAVSGNAALLELRAAAITFRKTWRSQTRTPSTNARCSPERLPKLSGAPTGLSARVWLGLRTRRRRGLSSGRSAAASSATASSTRRCMALVRSNG